MQTIAREHPRFHSKRDATAYVAGLGYTVHCGTSASGDHGHGSREYYTGPSAELNQYGWPLNTMSVSQVGANWMVS